MDAKKSPDWEHKLVQRHANAARALEHMHTEKNVERLKEVGAELEAALAALPSDAAQAPQGWKFVPVEPTEEMLDAARACERDWSDGFPKHADGYAAMLDAAPVPPAAVAPSAEIAGLESAIGHLSALVEAQRKLLVDVNEICGVDGHGGTLEDGESEIIDRVRAHLAILSDDHSGEADPLQCHSEGA